MAKLLDMNGSQMAAALVKLAAPLKRFMEDEEFDRAFKNATKKGLQTGMTDVLQIYTEIVPLLLGDRHLKDTLSIVSVIEGKPIKELMEMNGTDLLADIIAAFTEQIKPFFMRLGVGAGVKQ